MAGARLKPRDNSKVGVVPFAVPADESAGPNPVPDLGPVVAARLEDWSRAYNIPVSTLRALRAAGKGPSTFEVGRLIFITRDDWCAWLEGLAAVGGTGPLSPRAGRFGRRTNRGTTANTGKR